MANDPWYADGLPFTCTQCGDCCTGDPGAVWVTETDLDQIAEYAGESADDIRRERTRMIGDRRSLTERENGDCTYFDAATRQCRIYPVRPLQCRTWPFWPGNLETPASWAETQCACPGARQGKIVPVDEIIKRAKMMPQD